MIDISKDIHSLSDFKRKTSVFLDQLDQLQALEGIKRGLTDVEAGRVTPLKEFEKEFRAKHGLSRRSR